MEVLSQAITSEAVKLDSQVEVTDITCRYTLYISNLSKRTRQKDLENLFRKFNPIQVRMKFFHETGESRRFAFVDFRTESAGEGAMRELSGREVYGRVLNIEKSYEKDDLTLFETVKKRKEQRMMKKLQLRDRPLHDDPDDDSLPLQYEKDRSNTSKQQATQPPPSPYSPYSKPYPYSGHSNYSNNSVYSPYSHYSTTPTTPYMQHQYHHSSYTPFCPPAPQYSPYNTPRPNQSAYPSQPIYQSPPQQPQLLYPSHSPQQPSYQPLTHAALYPPPLEGAHPLYQQQESALYQQSPEGFDSQRQDGFYGSFF